MSNLVCPKCHNHSIYVYSEISGGCEGHGPDEYCYCPSKDISFHFYCTTSRCSVSGTLHEISDKESLLRFIKEHNGSQLQAMVSQQTKT